MSNSRMDEIIKVAEAGGGDEIESAAALVEAFFELEHIDVNVYRAPTHTVNTGFTSARVFGGVVVSQSLVAASKTVPVDYIFHSLHCYFIRPGDNNKNILYLVDRARDGRSFCTRYVKAMQDGQQIFTCELSFHKENPTAFKMTPKFPSSVPPPESLKSVGALLREMIANTNIDETIRRRLQDRLLSEPKMLDIRPIHPERYLANNAAERGLHSQLWMKARGRLGDHVMVHLSTAAFASDYGLLSAAIRHVPSVGFAASLDHSMWIHEFRFRMDDWCLYDVECSSIGDDRGLVFGRMWSRDGTLLLSTAQEGVIRQKI